MQNIYTTFEFHKIQELLIEYSKTELGREKINNLQMFSNINDIKNELLDLNEMISVTNRLG